MTKTVNHEVASVEFDISKLSVDQITHLLGSDYAKDVLGEQTYNALEFRMLGLLNQCLNGEERLINVNLAAYNMLNSAIAKKTFLPR